MTVLWLLGLLQPQVPQVTALVRSIDTHTIHVDDPGIDVDASMRHVDLEFLAPMHRSLQ